MNAPHIMLVEDDEAIAQSLMSGLSFENYSCTHYSNAEDVLTNLKGSNFHIALLDIRLPGMDGLQLCKKIREAGYHFPIIFLSARDEVIDKILGLEIGADDYMVKPYSFRELLSRIRAHLRRTSEYRESDQKSSFFNFASIKVDTESMRIWKDNNEIDITPTEYKILYFFIENESHLLSRSQIINFVWGENFFLEDLRTVDVHIRHLREKLEVDPSNPCHIQTVRGYGYRFVKKP